MSASEIGRGFIVASDDGFFYGRVSISLLANNGFLLEWVEPGELPVLIIGDATMTATDLVRRWLSLDPRLPDVLRLTG